MLLSRLTVRHPQKQVSPSKEALPSVEEYEKHLSQNEDENPRLLRHALQPRVLAAYPQASSCALPYLHIDWWPACSQTSHGHGPTSTACWRSRAPGRRFGSLRDCGRAQLVVRRRGREAPPTELRADSEHAILAGYASRKSPIVIPAKNPCPRIACSKARKSFTIAGRHDNPVKRSRIFQSILAFL